MSTVTPRGPRLRLAAAAAAPARPWAGAPWPLLLGGTLAIALLSLLFTDTVTYDPTSWLVWGREIAHAQLVTNGGPSWKPLPIVFTTPLSLLGDHAGPSAWLVVARWGGLVGVGLAFVIARRLAGGVAGLISAAAVLLADEWVFQFGRGTSEGMLIGVAFAAIERHLAGHRRQAFACAVLTALLRPEVWPLLAVYGLWLVAGRPAGAARVRGFAVAVAAGLLVVACWLVPEKIGSGDFFRAASRALLPVADSPALAAHPFLATFSNSAKALSVPAYVGGVAAAVLAAWAVWRRRAAPRDVALLVLALAATELMITVAILAQIGFTGNLRYVTMPAALAALLAGPGFALLWERARALGGVRVAAAGATVLAVASVPLVLRDVRTLRDDLRTTQVQDRQMHGLYDIVDAAGGRGAVLRCAPVVTDVFQTQAVAWILHLHTNGASFVASGEGTVLAPRGTRVARDERYAEVLGNRSWVLARSPGCGAGPG
jgi:hypothetical protein